MWWEKIILHSWEEEEHDPSQGEETQDITPTIYCHALARISTPQTLKIERCIQNKKVIVFIDSSSTNNFIHYKLAKVLNFYIYLAPKFEVMIVVKGTINCSGKCHNINLTMGEYALNNLIIYIPMGGADVVLGI